MAAINGKLKKPEPNKKKITIIIAIVSVIVLSASGGLYVMFKGGQEPDTFGRRRINWSDTNMPNPEKQSAKQIIDYRSSERYKQLSDREKFLYTMASGRKLMDYHIETYFTVPKEQQTAYLDRMIDEMQAQRANFEQMRRDTPRPQRPRDMNDPNRQARQAERAARRANPANARARSERGTALQRAQRTQFMAAMQKRMQERGMSMPGRGGFGGGRGGR
ncbi:MAG: hypothetical protein BWY69_00507 [Planctomycetes bacterium ADurb.Bin401]|nr:MAG: hypothetical protein BWY69_00507 [Planctomycetes bacterium ADurb.Bin401]